jgi:hypothetical protein
MRQQVDTIDPKEVTVMVAGNVIEGFSEDKILVARESNQVEDELGSDGDVARRITNDKRGNFTITLLQTSRSNLIFTGLARADELTGNGIFPVVVKDNRGNDLYIGASCWIQKMPDAAYGTRINTRVWVIRTNNLNMTVGGAA